MRATTRRFLQLWLGTSLLCAGVTIGVALALGANLAPPARAEALRLLHATGSLPYLAVVITVAVTGFLSAWLTRGYFVPLSAAAEATALAALSNAAHRVPVQGTGELRQLIGSINVLAERHQTALDGLNVKVQEALRAHEAERNRLAVLIAELPQGVIVCNAQGLILLYNEQARALLCPAEGRVFLGLGRSLYALIPDAPLCAAIAQLAERDARGEIDPASELCIGAGTRRIRIRVAPVAGGIDPASGATAPAGFVLVLESAGVQSMASHAAVISETNARAPSAGRPVFYDFDLFRCSPSSAQAERHLLAQLAYTVFDTETTGLEPSAGDEIVAIGAVRIVNARIVADSFDCLLDPGRPVDPRSTRVHGLTDTMLRGQPSIGIVLPRFHAYCADTVLIGHNVAFDLRFLQLKERSTGVRFEQPVLDTLLLSALLHEHLADDRLEAIAHRFGIEARARHTALGDAALTAEIFLKMLPLLAARGITTLRQAQDASRRTRYARIRY